MYEYESIEELNDAEIYEAKELYADEINDNWYDEKFEIDDDFIDF